LIRPGFSRSEGGRYPSYKGQVILFDSVGELSGGPKGDHKRNTPEDYEKLKKDIKDEF
jgi:hypothetical protein